MFIYTYTRGTRYSSLCFGTRCSAHSYAVLGAQLSAESIFTWRSDLYSTSSKFCKRGYRASALSGTDQRCISAPPAAVSALYQRPAAYQPSAVCISAVGCISPQPCRPKPCRLNNVCTRSHQRGISFFYRRRWIRFLLECFCGGLRTRCANRQILKVCDFYRLRRLTVKRSLPASAVTGSPWQDAPAP